MFLSGSPGVGHELTVFAYYFYNLAANILFAWNDTPANSIILTQSSSFKFCHFLNSTFLFSKTIPWNTLCNTLWFQDIDFYRGTYLRFCGIFRRSYMHVEQICGCEPFISSLALCYLVHHLRVISTTIWSFRKRVMLPF